MTMYASRTGTRRNLAALRGAGWRLLVSAAGVWRHEGFPYCLDNGAWSAHTQGIEWDPERFRACVALLGSNADWIALPDIVGGGLRSLALSLRWVPELAPVAPLLLPVQDGMDPADLRGMLGPGLGIFLGGSTKWKLATMPDWGRLALETGCHYHVARVNTARRIRSAQLAGAHSVDGSSATRFACTLPPLDRARRQLTLPLGVL
jgi:hypothetical protein